MPTAPYAKLLVRVNAGAPVSGAVFPALSDSIALSIEDAAFVVQQRFEIYDYPAGFALPSGWSDTGTGTYFYEQDAFPPAFTVTPWGKYMLRLTVNRGRNGAGNLDPSLLDESTALSVLSPSGLADLGYLETTQFNAQRIWTGDHKANLRVIDSGLGGAVGVVPATPNTTAKRGGAGQGFFTWVAPTSTGIAQAIGLLRTTSAAQAAVAARNAANSADVALIGVDGLDGVVVGDATHGAYSALQAAGSGVGSLFVIVHSAFGVAVQGDAANGVAIGAAAGGIVRFTARTFVGLGSSWAQFGVNPRPFAITTVAPLAVDFDAFGSNPDFTLTANATLSAPTNVVGGGRYMVTVRQGAGGPYTMTWDAAFHFGLTFNGVLTAVGGAVDVFQFVGDSSGVLYCVGASKGVQ